MRNRSLLQPAGLRPQARVPDEHGPPALPTTYLHQLEYISSAGFRILLLAGRRAEETDARLVLCSVTGKVRQLFDLGGFLDLFVISGSREEAIRAMQ